MAILGGMYVLSIWSKNLPVCEHRILFVVRSARSDYTKLVPLALQD